MVHAEALKENPNANLPEMLFLKGEWGKKLLT
jgi:hypothetical protein